MKRITILYLLLLFSLNGLYAQNIGQSIISDFYQGNVPYNQTFADCKEDKKWGNCATIALIKAAIVQFQTPEQIFKSYIRQGDSTHIVFNDGYKITITKSEIETAAGLSGFEKSNDSHYFDLALLLYTSICKRVFNKRTEYIKGGCMTQFTDAIHYINSGYITEKVGELLGMKLVRIKRSSINNRAAVIVKTSAHAAFSWYGLQDFMGKPFKIRAYLMRNPIGPPQLITGAYILSKTL